MKFSVKLPDSRDQKNPIVRGKLPITIFNQPFTSSFTSAINSSSDLSFSLSTNFLSGPCLKFTYSPTIAVAASTAPFSLSLKSGLGLFGSPEDSPLIFSAQFPLSLTKPIIPTFSLHFQPQFGHFCLKKSTVSNANSDPFSGFQTTNGVNTESGSHSSAKFGSGFAVDESTGWQEVKLEACSGNGSQEKQDVFEPRRPLDVAKSVKDGVFSGVAVMARTTIPVTKRVAVNFRWGMNFPTNLVTKMPYLTVNKISVHRVEEGKGEKKTLDCEMSDMEVMKGMLFWMKKDMEILEKENREMKQFLDEIRLGNVANKASPLSGGSYVELEPRRNNRNFGEETKSKNYKNVGGQENYWRKKNSEEENECKDNWRCGEKNGLKGQNSINRVNEVESELERAIKAASQIKA